MSEEERQVDDESVTVTLHRDVRVLDKSTRKLTFREPTAWDIDKIGNPFFFSDGGVKCNYSTLISMLVELSGTTVGTFGKQMKAKDLEQCRFAVQGFFMPSAPLEEIPQTTD